MIGTGGIFADRLLGAILSLPAINLSISFLSSPKAAPEVFAIVRGIRAWSSNLVLETRQSLASSDFRSVFKKHSDAKQGKHGIAF